MDDFEDLFSDWLDNTVEVKTWAGDGATGAKFLTSVAVTGVYVEDTVNQVTDTSGNQVVSKTVLYVPAADLSHFTPGSKVTSPALEPGVESRVVTVSRLTVPGLPSHAVVYLG